MLWSRAAIEVCKVLRRIEAIIAPPRRSEVCSLAIPPAGIVSCSQLGELLLLLVRDGRILLFWRRTVRNFGA